MIKGVLTKFRPLKTGEVSVLVTTTKEYLHELVDLQDKEISIQAVQTQFVIQVDQKQLLDDISKKMSEIKQMLQAFPQGYEQVENYFLLKENKP